MLQIKELMKKIKNFDIKKFFSNEENDDLKKTIWEYTHQITSQDI